MLSLLPFDLAALAFGFGLLPALIAITRAADLSVQPPGRLTVVVVYPLLETRGARLDAGQVAFQLRVVASKGFP